jgi:hypothetical protein
LKSSDNCGSDAGAKRDLLMGEAPLDWIGQGVGVDGSVDARGMV